jgi:hypothetical protein
VACCCCIDVGVCALLAMPHRTLHCHLRASGFDGMLCTSLAPAPGLISIFRRRPTRLPALRLMRKDGRRGTEKSDKVLGTSNISRAEMEQLEPDSRPDVIVGNWRWAMDGAHRAALLWEHAKARESSMALAAMGNSRRQAVLAPQSVDEGCRNGSGFPRFLHWDHIFQRISSGNAMACSRVSGGCRRPKARSVVDQIQIHNPLSAVRRRDADVPSGRRRST